LSTASLSAPLQEIRQLLNKPVVFLYRAFAIVSLYAVLAGVLMYALLMAFYAVNNSWIAPVIFSPYDKESLELTQKLVASTQTLDDLKLDVERLQTSLAEMRRHKAQLETLEPELAAAIARERSHYIASGPEISATWREKREANLRTMTIDRQTAQIERRLDQELAAGLITKSDAAIWKSQLNQTHVNFIDSRLGEILLKDDIVQRNTSGTKMLAVLDKQAELVSQIAQLDIAIGVAKKQSKTESTQIERLTKAIATATETPYYLTMTGAHVPLALVPYDNQSDLAVGAPLYDCYLNMIACRKVGTVKKVFTGEQHGTHPIFRTDLRGFLIQLDLQNPDAAKSKVLFVNRKPLLI
jgi:hypothetical protein